jgi:two-component system, cell cycle sensor histidine kinase and response regulator CckA
VPQPELTSHPFGEVAHRASGRSAYVLLGSLALFGAGVSLWPGPLALPLLAAAGALVALAAVLGLTRLFGESRDRSAGSQVAAFVEQDASPSFTAAGDGSVLTQNRAAGDRFGDRTGQTISRLLSEMSANSGAVFFRLQTRAAQVGSAREDIVTRRGHVRIAAHRMGRDAFLWRFEDMVERIQGSRGADTISLPMLTASKSGTVLFMNEALRRLMGGRVKTLDRIFPILPLTGGHVHEVSAEGGPIRALVIDVDRGAGHSEIYLLPVPAAGAEIQGDVAFANLPVAMVRLGLDGAVRATNQAAEALVGKVAEGARFPDLFEGLGRSVKDWIDDVASGRSGGRPEVLRWKGDGPETFLQVSLSRIRAENDVTLIAVLTDATQLKTLEAQFVQSQKMQAIGQLAGGIAHDFNNLLTAISGHCDLLLLRHDRKDPDYNDLTQINQNANRAASLVSQLLAFSRKQTLTPRIIDLRDTLSDLTHLLNRLVGEKVALTLTHDPALKSIRADKRQLEQVIMNLVVNARDAMPKGGAIRIETENAILSAPMVRDRAAVPPGGYVVVRVIDEGQGIPPDKMGKIFEPFFTTKRAGEGTGLGLSTAYGIVKQTGGYIFCESAVGSGTTFSIYFPAHEAAEAEPPEPAPMPLKRRTLQQGEGVVLLVEDEAPVRAFASRALRLRGYTVIEAGNAEEALGMLADGSLSVDVFVTDVIMPGMDGPTWVREALKVRPNTRVVFVSGYAEESFGEGRDLIPNSVFLPKPFSLTELTATVQRQLH